LHNELHDLYSVLDIVRVIKPRTMKWVGTYFTHSGEWKLVLCFDVENPWEKKKKKLCR
jgi:hypothetical protein